MCLSNVVPLQKAKAEIKAYKLFGVYRGKLYSAFSSAFSYHSYPMYDYTDTMPNYKPNVLNTVVEKDWKTEGNRFNSFRYFEDAMEVKSRKHDNWAFWTDDLICLPVTISNDIMQGGLRFANRFSNRVREAYPAYLSKNLIVHVNPEVVSEYRLEL